MSFKENFGREENTGENLSYDDAAFYFFFSAITGIALCFLGWHIVQKVIK